MTAPLLNLLEKINSYLKVENRKLENERVIMDHKNPCQSHTPSIISECCGHKIHLSGSRTSLLPPAAFAGPRLDLWKGKKGQQEGEERETVRRVRN